MRRSIFLGVVVFLLQFSFVQLVEVRAPREGVNTVCFISNEKTSCDCCCPKTDTNNDSLISAIEGVEQTLSSKIDTIDCESNGCDCSDERIISAIDEAEFNLCSKIEAIDCTCNCECNGGECDCSGLESSIDDLALKLCVITSALDGLIVDRSGFEYNCVSNILDSINTTEVHVLTVRNRTMFGGNPNTVDLRVAAFGGGSVDEPNKAVIMRLYKDATVTGLSFTDLDTANSVIEFSTVGTYTVSTGKKVIIRPCNNNSNGPAVDYIPLNVYDVILEPGDSVTITAINDNGMAKNILGSLFFEERF